MATTLFLGVDGGGSRTTVVIGDEAGHIVARVEGGPTNLHSVGAEAALHTLGQIIDQALTGLGVQRPRVRVACLGMAGYGRPAERLALRRWAAGVHLAERVLLVNDADLVLAAGTPAGWGLALIAGTGSLCCGRAPGGAGARAGGWGYLLGDEGSGYSIGLAALRAIVRAADGRGPAPAFAPAVLAALPAHSVEELIPWVYRSPIPRSQIAALAPLVGEAAAGGDPMAEAILCAAAEDLAQLAVTVARRLGLSGQAVPCALGGGLLVHMPALARGALQAAADDGAVLAPVTCVEDPARGALRLARDEVPAPEDADRE